MMQAQPMSELELKFHRLMAGIPDRVWSAIRYPPNRFRNALQSMPGYMIAHHFLSTSEPSDGFIALWSEGRADLSLENEVLQHPEFHHEFSEAELRVARERMRDGPGPKKR